MTTEYVLDLGYKTEQALDLDAELDELLSTIAKEHGGEWESSGCFDHVRDVQFRFKRLAGVEAAVGRMIRVLQDRKIMEYCSYDEDESLECPGHPTTEGPIGNVVYCDGTCQKKN